MALDPQIAALLEVLEQRGLDSLSSGTPEQARQALSGLIAEFDDPANRTPVAAVEAIEIPGPAGPIPARLYRPREAADVAVVAFFHGGGWVIGDLETHDEPARRICDETGAVVISIDYRLAPEHPFPAAYEDCLAATRWAAAHEELGTRGVAVAGDSAGGNLAATVALGARSERLPVRAQMLIYPATDMGGEYTSRQENAEGYFLTLADMGWFTGHYLPGGQIDDERASPLRAASLAGLPPAVVGLAGFDPLRDEGRAYANALADAGVPVELHQFDTLIHGFFGFNAASEAAEQAVAQLCADFREVLGRAA